VRDQASPDSTTLQMVDTEEDSNRSGNRDFADVLSVNLARRSLMQGVALAFAGAAATPLMARAAGIGSGASTSPAASMDKFLPAQLPARPGFAAVAVTRADTITVPSGYTARAFLRWGEPLMADGPAYRDGGLNSAEEQEQQVGMHHDGMNYFPIAPRPGRPNRGVLAFNNEYVDVEYLHAGGASLVNGARDAEQVRKEIAAHGVTLVEIAERDPGVWERVSSKLNRRITAATPMAISGPARGSTLLKTKYSPDGTATRGTLNNCASGQTPWGTYLTCEENWAGYHVNKDATRPREQTRYGVPSTAGTYQWETVDERFDAGVRAAAPEGDFRNAPNTFGWVVEIDPFNPNSIPKKRTALGRFGHEGAVFAPVVIGQPMTIYMGDDARNEYIYKFVTRSVYLPSPQRVAENALDEGTLYVARFNDDGSGEWLALDIDDAAFRAAAAVKGVGFLDQADVLVNARLAADVVGATKMDRPEWSAVDPLTGEVYFTLTNNSARTAAQVSPSNPRGPNDFGHIIRWRERGDRNDALRFDWELFVLSGTSTDSAVLPGEGGDRKLDASNIHASPDGLWFDRGGLLWIQTDMSGSQLNAGPFGNNQMLAADPASGEIRRFLVGPVGSEVTGITATPDLRTLFVNIQHPAEGSHWPDGGTARPRSAVVIVTKDDGGIIGS
jgi:secreted PhoX family phosphatase